MTQSSCNHQQQLSGKQTELNTVSHLGATVCMKVEVL